MSYNPRMSMAPNSQQQSRGKKKEDDSDSFMRLVSGCGSPPLDSFLAANTITA